MRIRWLTGVGQLSWGSCERYAKGIGSFSLHDPGPAPAAPVGSRSRERSAWGGRRPCCCVTDDEGPSVSLSWSGEGCSCCAVLLGHGVGLACSGWRVGE